MFGPSNSAVPVVTIKPGALAEAVFTGHDVPTGARSCPPSYRHLRVTPPGDLQSVVISAWLPAPSLGEYLPACSPIWITPVVPPSELYQGPS
jgi:hypothetical protein